MGCQWLKTGDPAHFRAPLEPETRKAKGMGTRKPRDQFAADAVTGLTVIEFGKHKVKTALEIRDEDQNYVKWVMEREDQMNKPGGHPQAPKLLDYFRVYYHLVRPKGMPNYLSETDAPPEVIQSSMMAKGQSTKQRAVRSPPLRPVATRDEHYAPQHPSSSGQVSPTDAEMTRAFAVLQQRLCSAHSVSEASASSVQKE